MASSNQYSLEDIPNFSVTRLIEDGVRKEGFPGSLHYKVEIKPDPDHPWVQDWPEDQVFGCTYSVDEFTLFQSDDPKRTKRDLMYLHVKNAWEEWWHSHWRHNGKRLSILERPEYAFVLGGAL